MSVSYDVTTPTGQVRLLSFDTDVSNPNLQDEEYNALLGLNNQSVRLAAAQAVEVLAANEAFVQKATKLLDLFTDGAKTATALQAYAKELRRQEYEGDGDMSGFIDWAEQVEDPWTMHERFVKQWMRTSQ